MGTSPSPLPRVIKRFHPTTKAPQFGRSPGPIRKTVNNPVVSMRNEIMQSLNHSPVRVVKSSSLEERNQQSPTIIGNYSDDIFDHDSDISRKPAKRQPSSRSNFSSAIRSQDHTETSPQKSANRSNIPNIQARQAFNSESIRSHNSFLDRSNPRSIIESNNQELLSINDEEEDDRLNIPMHDKSSTLGQYTKNRLKRALSPQKHINYTSYLVNNAQSKSINSNLKTSTYVDSLPRPTKQQRISKSNSKASTAKSAYDNIQNRENIPSVNRQSNPRFIYNSEANHQSTTELRRNSSSNNQTTEYVQNLETYYKQSDERPRSNENSYRSNSFLPSKVRSTAKSPYRSNSSSRTEAQISEPRLRSRSQSNSSQLSFNSNRRQAPIDLLRKNNITSRVVNKTLEQYDRDSEEAIEETSQYNIGNSTTLNGMLHF